MKQMLYRKLHEKADEINVTILINNNTIKILNSKPKHYMQIMDVIITADATIKDQKSYIENGTHIDQITLEKED